MKNKFIVRDAVYGEISLPKITSLFIDTSEFQRLRHIKQNSLMYLVFPGANHTRFEHSIGTAYLAKKWYSFLMEQYKENIKDDYSKDYKSEQNVTINFEETLSILNKLKDTKMIRTSEYQRWEDIVTLAGLLHDIGHGPLSHTIEKLDLLHTKNFSAQHNEVANYLNSNESTSIKHEDIGLFFVFDIFKKLQQENSRPEYSDFYNKNANCYIICSLFNKNFRKFCFEKNYLTDEDKKLTILFSPMISGILDVDRFDYLKRDSQHSGVSYGFEQKRLIKNLYPVLVTNNESKTQTSHFFTKHKTIHMVDYFMFSLYQFYIQALFHPRSLQFEDQLKIICRELNEKGNFPTISYSEYKKMDDSKFLKEINDRVGGLVERVFNRDLKGKRKYVMGMGKVDEVDWHCVAQNAGRKIVSKDDSFDIWLSVSTMEGKVKLASWKNLSLIYSKLSSEEYCPIVWWEDKVFDHLIAMNGQKLKMVV